MPTGGRKTHLQVMHECSFQIGPAEVIAAGNGVTRQFGVLPAGAIMAAYHVVTPVAFDSTTITINVGTANPNGGEVFGPLNLKTVQKLDGVTTSVYSGPFPVDTPLYWTPTWTGPAPTVGQSVTWVEYLPGPG